MSLGSPRQVADSGREAALPSGGPVLPLTRADLKRAFPDNHKLHDGIDQTFTSDSDLAQYDSFHKMYKVNWLLSSSGGV